ncbi:hypothetical protein [Agrococcus sp. Ld7]|uniref:hypothetical protein n=1 Tax=Agrococcus sp. Ld7 TaxID=649148 RepID=UPI0038681DFF
MGTPFMPAEGIVLAGIAIWIGVTVLVLVVCYWVIRLAVRHALRDVASERPVERADFP